jgi:apolipoprotein N-acyltransferase
MVRAAQTGISVVYDAFGREVTRIDLGRTGTAAEWLPGSIAAPAFARHGIALPFILMFLFALIATTPRNRNKASRNRDNSHF